MKQVYLDTIILRVIENTGNDPDLREDFVRRVVRQRLKDVVPNAFFPICMSDLEISNGITFLYEQFLDVLCVVKQREAPEFVCILDEKVYDPNGVVAQDYVTEADVHRYSTLLGDYDFTVDLMTDKIAVYTEEPVVSVFYYTPYKDKMGRLVVPAFAESYLEAYGTMRALEVLLNKGLRGRNPGMVPQTRYTVNELKRRVSREYLSMQRDINLLMDKIIVKPINSEIDASF